MTDTSAQPTWNDWIGSDVVDSSETKVGSLGNVYMDRASGQPEWLAVKTGMFGNKETFVPIGGTSASSDGDSLMVPFSKDQVKGAPNVDPDDGYLSPEQEAELYRHYGREQDYKQWDDSETDITVGQQTTGRQTVGRDTSGPETDDAMTRSEEELQVGTRQTGGERARLRKYVVTENVTTTVPVRKEVARIVREPITDANVGDAMDGPDISSEEHEVVLNQEEVVVDKKVVPKERVRLDKDVEVEQRSVTDEVRKEVIETGGDTETTTGDNPKGR